MPCSTPRMFTSIIRFEFSGRLFDIRAYCYKVQIDLSKLGKPTENSFIETFNDSLSDEFLNLN